MKIGRFLVAAGASLLVACTHAASGAKDIWVGVGEPGKSPKAAIGLATSPYSQGGPSATASLSPESQGRTAAGERVTGVLIRGWRDAELARVQVYMLVAPAAQSDGTTSDTASVEVEFASYLLKPGESKFIQEMRQFGVEPFVLTCQNGAFKSGPN